MDAANLFDEDVLAWSERQVAELRRLAASPGLTNAVDWENVIEEIESLGRSHLDTVESLVENALVHLLKIASDPNSLSQRQWRKETTVFLKQARGRFRRSMARAIDLDELWRRAVRGATLDLEAYDRSLRHGTPPACPFSLDDFLDPAFDDTTGLRILSQATDGEDVRS